MREYSVPTTIEIGPRETLLDPVLEAEREHPAEVLIRRTDAAGIWRDVTAAEFGAQVRAVARGLVAAGVGAGERVALLSRTRYEWTLLDYAILSAGAVTVPIYETSSAEQIAWILSDSGAVAAVVETDRHAGLVAEADPGLEKVWTIEPTSGDGAVDALTALGTDVSDDDVRARHEAVGADDLATLIYTSGTTGRPKGVELTHRNLVSEVHGTRQVLAELLNVDGSVLLFLPLAHIFGKVIQCGAIASRTTIGHTPDVKDLLGDLASFRPTFLLAVPRVFEKVYNGARQKAHSEGKGAIFDIADATAVAWSRALDEGGPGLGLKIKHAVFDRLVYGKLRAAVGGRVLGAVSGSAPLGERLGHFFRGIGLPVLEGYGLTETSAGITVNAMSAQRVGTVGRPVPGQSVKIADDGEILLKGSIVFSRYWKNPTATAEAIEDGWFHSGDIGELDDQGFLRITGRKKEIIVTAGGKNVAPAVLEDRLRAHPLISQCMVVGDAQPFIAALVTVDPEALPGWLERNGKPTATVADVVDDPDLRKEIEAAVADANMAVSRAEQIREFRILPGDFTEATGELTPTMKVKRAVVASNHADVIAGIYSGTRQPA
ncbi:MAG: long-chain fatty acid--CoA ligase [Pseudonocardia sp.]|uniref:AMP-dependent synthetase/ligase n=1 Tax=unclassified Pseudonocardia TaxID=2619320 RepID=UPI000868E269|nr:MULTISPECIES: AMP-dependent synthetase/ligase [unclassified Pseudonocardia]MBN9107739.1 long-chain fatty acid--CoA ligase [Pseudonocardia sp.]ODU19607.1 MAG: long-chain fatty acid--CoA ligase [Pseudonocardia sp. SCN 72-51]ODV07593.1 MAG: long-chain fatty acid--CoA ligase [Pseudonocardia sp. SCN 73-27]